MQVRNLQSERSVRGTIDSRNLIVAFGFPQPFNEVVCS